MQQKKQTTRDIRSCESADIVRTIGNRMRQARELSNMSQQVAAKRLGYMNSSKLSKVELASNSRTIPLWLVLKAARLYQVSTDFLFGLSDSWDVGPRRSIERETNSWLTAQWESIRERDMAAIKLLNDRLETIDGAVLMTVQRAFDIEDAFATFRHLNGKAFEEMRGGAKLAAAIERASESASEARAKLTRFRMSCRDLNRGEGGQFPLFSDEGGNE